MRFRKDGIMAEYLRLQEAGSPSDFPNVMLDAQHKLLIKAFRGVEGSWKSWCKIGDLADFKTHNRIVLGESGDLLERQPGAPYQETTMADYKYQIQLKTFGRTFNLLRETVINDDLNAFQETPAKLGRGAARTIAKATCKLLETNGPAYDGNAMFTTGHSNMSSTALTADTNGIAALQAAIKAIATSTDPGTSEILGIKAKYLLVSPTLAETAAWLLSSVALVGGATTNGLASNPLLTPKLSQKLELLVDPFLTSFPSRWYVLADPNDLHAAEVGFLEGNQEPALLMKDPGSMKIGGGSDPWGYEYDDIEYKVRYDFATKPAFYQAAYKGGA